MERTSGVCGECGRCAYGSAGGQGKRCVGEGAWKGVERVNERVRETGCCCFVRQRSLVDKEGTEQAASCTPEIPAEKKTSA